jgi:hypothetical protein
MQTTRLLASLATLAVTASLGAQDPSVPPPAGRDLDVTVGGGYLHQFDADIDGGGSVAVDRGYGVVGSRFEISPAVSLGLRVAWEGGWYHFDGASPLTLGTGSNPWHSVQGIQVGAQLGWRLDDRWSLSTGIFGGAAGEPDADAGDALSFGGSVGVAWRANDQLTIGGGVLVASQLEDDALVIPLLTIDWQITDHLRLSNVAGPEAYPTGAGIELVCEAWEAWEFGIGGRWESRRFRLDDRGPAPNGVGEDQGLGLWLRAGVRPTAALRIDLLLGLMVAEEFELDDRNGNRLAKTDVDPAPFIAGFLSYEF